MAAAIANLFHKPAGLPGQEKQSDYYTDKEYPHFDTDAVVLMMGIMPCSAMSMIMSVCSHSLFLSLDSYLKRKLNTLGPVDYFIDVTYFVKSLQY